MKNFKNKTAAIAIALLLTFSICGPLIALLPTAGAHTPAWIINPTAYLYVSPNPGGVGQQALIVGWFNWQMQGAFINNTIRYHNVHFIITNPNGTAQKTDIPVVADSTGSSYIPYTPTVAGVYNITFLYDGQVYDFPASQMTPSGAQNAYEGDYYTPANASILWTVNQEPTPSLPENPVPNAYWTRPINENQNIFSATQIGSSWLGGSYVTQYYTQFNGAVPLSSHIMWTRPIELGGLVGGTLTQPQQTADIGSQYYLGFSYNVRFSNPLIIQGILYYSIPNGFPGTGGGEYAVDLLTGQTIWNNSAIAPFSKGQILNYKVPDNFGPIGAFIWTVSGSTWIGYNAFTMQNNINLTNVPSGTEVYLNNGEIDRYVFSYNTTSNKGWVALWNSTAALTQLLATQVFYINDIPSGGGWVINANTPACYTWNTSITTSLAGTPGVTPSIVGVIPGDVILGTSSSLALTATPNPTTNPWTVWALNDQPGQQGKFSWLKNYPAPPNNNTLMFATQPMDPYNDEWTMTVADTGQRLAFSLKDGTQLWGPTGPVAPQFQYYSSREGMPAYGNLYVSGYGGIVYCYSMLSGSLLWTYGNGGSGNSTNMADNGPWGNYPTHIAAFAGGVVYTMSGEHSPNTPLYKGEKARAINATTGQEIWTLLSWSASGLGTSIANVAIADGYMVFANGYDNQLYCVGQGPSKLTVSTPDTASTVGVPVIIRGTVTDISAGATQAQQAANFPNGLPCVSDASESQWMEYVYQDQQMPTDVTGVPVSLYVIDANNNYRQIGQTTTDSSGFFTYSWAPDIPGNYTVIANFAGSNSYYRSSSESSFYATAEHATAAPTATPISLATTQNYIIGIGIAIIVVVIIIGAILAMLLLRRRP